LAGSPKISGSGRDRGPKIIQETEMNKRIGSKRVMMISTGMRTYHANYIIHERKTPETGTMIHFCIEFGITPVSICFMMGLENKTLEK
jgi:hypothetical protein